MSARSLRVTLMASAIAMAFVPAAGFATDVQKAPQICDREFARAILATRDYPAFCGCTTITDAFIREVQSSPDFRGVIGITDAYCPGMSRALLTPVATVPDAGGPEPDGGGRVPGDPPQQQPEPPTPTPPNGGPPEQPEPPDVELPA